MIATGLTLRAEDWTPTRIVAITNYPPRALQARILGDVVIKCALDGTGSVTTAQIASGHPLLSEQARENALLWKFEKTALGHDRSTSITLKYQYRLEGKPEGDVRTSFSVDLPNLIHIVGQILTVDR